MKRSGVPRQAGDPHRDDRHRDDRRRPVGDSPNQSSHDQPDELLGDLACELSGEPDDPAGGDAANNPANEVANKVAEDASEEAGRVMASGTGWPGSPGAYGEELAQLIASAPPPSARVRALLRGYLPPPPPAAQGRFGRRRSRRPTE